MKKQQLQSPMVQEKGLNEATYTAIMAMSQDEKNSLPDRLRNHIKTAKKAQNFVIKSSTDQKRELFEYLDYCFYSVIAPAGATGIRRFNQVFEEYRNGNVLNGLFEAAKTGIFVTGDKEFSFLLGKMSQSMTTAPYAQNLELIRAGNILKKWPTTLNHDDLDEYDFAADLMAKIILWAAINFEQSESAIGVLPEMNKMLFFMYINRNKYIKKETMVAYFNGLIGGQKALAAIKFLVDKKFIQKHVDWRQKEYTITKLGIRTVHQFRDRVLKSFNF